MGEARIGLARGSGIVRLAEPLKVVDSAEAISELSELTYQDQISGIVIGLPRNLSGEETSQTQAVRQWVKQAQAQIDIPFYWQDEALSSEIAEKRGGTDADAAAIILQDFLDTPKEQRVRC